MTKVIGLGYFNRYQGDGEEVLYARADDPINEELAVNFVKR
jgi:hypothetical protein